MSVFPRKIKLNFGYVYEGSNTQIKSHPFVGGGFSLPREVFCLTLQKLHQFAFDAKQPNTLVLSASVAVHSLVNDSVNNLCIGTVKFQRGYGGPGRPKPEQMVWTVKKVWLYESDTDQKGDPLNPPEGILPDCIAIDLGCRVS